MSLINQMLKDLDRRQASAGTAQPKFGDVRVSAASHSLSRLMFPLILVAGTAGLGTVIWQKYRDGLPPASTAPELAVTAAPAAKATPAPEQSAAVTPRKTAPTPAVASAIIPETSKPVGAPAAGNGKSVPATVTATAGEASVLSGGMESKLAAATAVVAHAAPLAVDLTKSAETTPGLLGTRISSMKVVSPKQRSDNLYRQAVSLVQRGHHSEAQSILRQAIEANPANHDARQMLAAILVDERRQADAMRLLQDGVALAPGNGAFIMALARLQLAAGAKADALSTLEQGLGSAGDDPDYHAFFAALLQGQGRHPEAIQHYIAALRSNPAMPAWLIGAGVSFQAENHLADAAEAFQRAIDTGEATPELTRFAEQRLSQLRQQR